MASENAQPLRVEVAQADDVVVVRPVGEVDIASVPTLQEVLNRQLDGGHNRLVVSLQELSYLDSTGLGCITAARRRARDAGGGLVVVCTRERLLRLLSITGLDQVMTICRTEAEAAEELRRSTG